MGFSFRPRRAPRWALALIIILTSALFIWWQAYISGRYIAKDFVVPTLAMVFGWGALALLGRLRYFKLMRLWALLLALLLALTCVLFEYYFALDIHMSFYDIGALMQTNFHEALSFVREFMISPWSIASFVVTLLITLLGGYLMELRARQLVSKIKLKPNTHPHLGIRPTRRSRYLTTGGLVLCLLGTVICCEELTLIKYSLRFMREVQHSIDYVTSVKPMAAKVVPAHKEQQGELYVLVIGESQNRDYMGLYHPLFATTPQLEASLTPEQSIIFTQAHSCFTHTVPALAYALSNQLMGTTQSANLAQIVTPDYTPLSAVLKGAQIKSFWLSNQNAKGISDIDTTMLARTFDGTKFMTEYDYERPKLDGVLLPEFQQLLQGLDPKANHLLVVHLMGTHGLYEQRYPQEYARFSPDELTHGQIGALATAHAPELSFYLNATYYNDYVLSELIAAARAHPNFMGLLFFSDHADQPPYGHIYTLYHPGMTHIPMFFTFSEQYAARYREKVERLRARRDEFFVNDRIYDLILDLMDVRSEAYRPELSLAHPDFQPLTWDDARMPDGQNSMADPDYQLWRYAKQLGDKLAILHCNAAKKLSLVQSLGVTQAAVDLSYDKEFGLCLSQNECQPDTVTLRDALQHSASKLYLDLSASARAHFAATLAELTALDEQYGLKHRAIVASTDPEQVAQLHAAGWSSSLQVTAALLHDGTLNTSDLPALSFDQALYDQVNADPDAAQLPQYVRIAQPDWRNL